MELLKFRDYSRQLFGASAHNYKFRPVKQENELSAFETRHNIKLPVGYREFLKFIGNGGAGPYYGIEPLENSLFESLDYNYSGNIIDPSKEFPFTEAWNMDLVDEDNEGAYYALKEDVYFDRKWVIGLLRISDFGCGILIILVVNGPDYGNIWVDDRVNNQGIFPDHYFGNVDRLTFLDWYELWLDKALLKIG